MAARGFPAASWSRRLAHTCCSTFSGRYCARSNTWGGGGAAARRWRWGLVGSRRGGRRQLRRAGRRDRGRRAHHAHRTRRQGLAAAACSCVSRAGSGQRSGLVSSPTCDLPSALLSSAARRGPTRPPLRALMNTINGASSWSYAASGFVPARNSWSILQGVGAGGWGWAGCGGPGGGGGRLIMLKGRSGHRWAAILRCCLRTCRALAGLWTLESPGTPRCRRAGR